MMYFSKKILMMVTIVFAFAIMLFFLFLTNKKKQIVSTVALPIENKVIILDAGHGVPDEGAQSVNGISEASINLAIVKKVQNLLEQAGSTVVLTRSDENGIYDDNSNTIREKKGSDIKNRVIIGNKSFADIFVSVHLNKIPQEKYWGWQTFFKEGNEESKKLSECLQEGLNQSIQKNNKRVPLKIENIYIIDHIEIPTSIIECGFLSNPEEEKLLQTEEYQQKIAWGIYMGIMNYFFNN